VLEQRLETLQVELAGLDAQPVSGRPRYKPGVFPITLKDAAKP
jgi:hypothetical protein